MVPRLVPEISPLDAFCDGGGGGGAAAGIGDSRSLMNYVCTAKKSNNQPQRALLLFKTQHF